MTRAMRILLPIVTTLFVLGCGPSPRTQITLVLGAESSVVADTTSVDVQFFDDEGVLIEQSTTETPSWPLSYALVRDTHDAFTIVISATNASSAVVSRASVRAVFAKGRTALLRIDLARVQPACVALTCALGTECTTATNPVSCAPIATIDASDLPTAPNGPEALESPCADVTCGGSETCTLVAGIPTCGCAFPAAGDGCTGCAAGYELDGATCVPECASGCDAHAFCDTGFLVPSCECARGYEDSGSGCVWVGGGVNAGGPRDPALNDATQWLVRQTMFDPILFSPTDGGATFLPLGVCGSSLVSQTFDMPEQSLAEPFLLEFVVRSNDTMFTGDTLPRARIGNSLLPLEYTGSGTLTGTACLGANGYGTGITLDILPDANGNPGICVENYGGQVKPPATLDNVRIVPTNTTICPAPGIRDGTFSTPGTPDWTFIADFNGGAGTASGVSGSAVLATTQLCQGAAVTQRVAFPTAAAVPNAALRFNVTGTSNVPLRITASAGNASVSHPLDHLADIVGAGAATNATICLPPGFQGTTRTLRFALGDLPGTCANALVRSFTFDNVEIVSDAACAGRTTSFDGGFEFGAVGAGFTFPEDSTPMTAPFASAIIDGVLARSGTGLFRANDGGTVTSINVRGGFDIPRDDDAATGPELRFFYRTSTTATTPTITIDVVEPVTILGTTGAWVEHRVCLPASLEGQRVAIPVRFARAGAGATTHFLDDVGVVLSADCP